MANTLKKRGQKIFRKFSRASIKASEKSEERIRKNLIERVSHASTGLRNLETIRAVMPEIVQATMTFALMSIAMPQVA